MKNFEAFDHSECACIDSTNLERIARLMWEKRIKAVNVVASNNRIIGSISDRDIAMEAMRTHLPLWQIRACQILRK